MTNLDSILKSRDVTLPANVHLVKAMVFPVVMYGCESWTTKKAEHWRIDSFELWCWRRLLGVSWTARRSNQSVLKEIRRRQWHPTPVLLPGKSHGWKSLVGCNTWGGTELDTTEELHFHFPALEKEMATHSSVLAWRIPEMGEPGGLPSTRSHRVGHDWSDLAAAAAAAGPI